MFSDTTISVSRRITFITDKMSSNKLEEEEKQEALQIELLKKVDNSKFTVHKKTVEETLA